MKSTRRLVVFGCAIAFTVGLASSAQAQLLSTVQKCIDQYNNKTRLVSQQAGKSARKCVKNAGKGLEANPDNCIVNNTDGKIAVKESKVVALYTSGKCTGAEPIQQGAATGNAAHRGAITDLAHDIFGDPVSGVISPGTDEQKCQDKAIHRATKAFTEKVKVHRKCKKDAMKAGTVVDEATLEAACQNPVIPDPKGKIGKKVQKLLDDVNDNCGTLVGSYPTLFSGQCSGSGSSAALGACLDRLVECRVCLALNEADGTDNDCDAFDDGIANGSCGIPEHKCVLAPSPASRIQIHIAALPVPLVFGLSGALDIGAAGAVGTCDIQMLAPVNIPAIGFVCIQPSGGCNPGTRWCGPGAGPALGVDLQSDGNAGACTSNAACDALAAAACAPDAVFDAACTGHCSGATPQACTTDADCLPANGACNGPDPVGAPQRDLCQIGCLDVAAHGGSDPGDIQCNLGAELNVETGAPCDGTDILINVGTTCLPVSTQRATSLISDANFSPGSFVPNPPNVNDLAGASIACPTLDASTTTALKAVGAVNFFGSALGDLAVGIEATCL